MVPVLFRRAFIALPVVAGSWHAEIQRCLPPTERVPAACDLHITLAFLGDCSSESAQAGWAVAKAAPPPAMAVQFAAPALLGSGRAVVFELEPAWELCGWMVRQRAAIIHAAGGRQPTHAPRPHLTMAWLKGEQSAGEKREWFRQLRRFEGTALTLDRMGLWCRARPEAAARYRELKTLVLAG